MSITLVTGVPGSGKTLYAVSKLICPMIGQTSNKVHDDGSIELIERAVFTNVNGLQLAHDLIDGGGTWTKKGDEWTHEGNAAGFRNWHRWAKAGSFIVCDEFQKFWPPRPNGAPIPPDIQALDTHRHMGVDFVLICQNVNNIDRHVVGLVDRHLHVRRVANMPMATVYEWDHCSRALLYKNAMSKTPFTYPRSAYKLYKSAEVHTKQRRKLPFVIWFILAGVAGVSYAVPTLKDRIVSRLEPAKVVETAAAHHSDADTSTYVKDGIKYTVQKTTSVLPLPERPEQLAAAGPLVSASGVPAAPTFAGCVVAASSDCVCYDTSGFKVEKRPELCPDPGRKQSVNLASIYSIPAEVLPVSASDARAIAENFSVRKIANN
nr:zonular occludens toxin domain-containing protein [uncultured Rhodoferax sp.]